MTTYPTNRTTSLLIGNQQPGGGHGVTALPLGNSPLGRTRISQRRGLTLTEILAATFVLSFGLVAALSVLPFATHLLSRMNVADTSGACGRGALQQIRMAGWQKPEALDYNWVDSNGDRFAPADPYVVDPLEVTGTSQPFPDAETGLFAFNLAEIADISDPDTKLAAANLHFRWNDDMIFAEVANSTRPALINPTDKTKQASGDYTWLYMVTPKIDPQADVMRPASGIAVTDPDSVLGYEVAAVVFHRRGLMLDSVRKVNLNPTNTTINAAGAYIELQSGDASAPGDPDVLDLSSIKWILLTGPGMEIQPGNAVPLNAQWYRITGYDDIQGSGIYTRRVFLVGPDWKGQKDVNGNPLNVYAILCDGVVNVFQATMPK